MKCFRRTFLLGLGGSGQLMLTHVKRLLYEHYGKVPPAIRFLALDTDAAVSQLAARTDGAKVHLTHGEYLQLSVEEPDTFLRRNKAVQDWFVEAGAISSIMYGAGGIRQNGRLALMHHVLEVRRRLREIEIDLTAGDLERRMNAADFELLERPIEVYICGSVAGGTGSGTFLDAGILMRHQSPNAHIHGFFLLDWIYQTKPFTHRVQGNVYAALCELDYLQSVSSATRNPYTVKYGDEEIKVTRPPYTMFHLIDGRNAVRQNIHDVHALCDVIARGIFISIGSLGEKVTSVVDNLLAHINSQNLHTWDGRPARYSSFGVGSICYPAGLIHRYASLNVARNLVQAALKEAQADPAGGAGLPAAIQEEAARVVSDVLVNRDNVRQKLCGVPPHRLRDYATLADAPGFPSGLDKLVEKEEAKLRQRVQGDLEADGKAFGDACSGGIRARLRERADNPALSALSHKQLTAALAERLRAMATEATANLGAAATALQESQKAVQEAVAATLSAPYVPYVRVRPRVEAVNRLRECSGKLFDAIGESMALDAEKSLYARLIEEISRAAPQSVAAASAVAEALRKASEQLDALRKLAADQLADLREDPTTLLVDQGATIWSGSADAKTYYDQAVSDDPGPVYREFKETAKINRPEDYLEVDRRGSGALAELFRQSAAVRLESLSKVTVIDALTAAAAAHPDHGAFYERQFASLFRLSSPMWLARESLLTGEQRPHYDDILTFGCPDVAAAQRLFGDVISNLRAKFRINADPAFASIDDTENIWLLDFSAALPLYFLADLETNKRRYEEGMTPPYHVDKRLEMDIQDLYPPHDRANIALRLLGMAIVKEVGVIQDRYLREELEDGRGHRFSCALPEILAANDGEPRAWDWFLTLYEDVQADADLVRLIHQSLADRLVHLMRDPARRASLREGIDKHIGRMKIKLGSRDFSRLVSARLSWREVRGLREFLDTMQILEPYADRLDAARLREVVDTYLKSGSSKDAARETVRLLGN